jgi:hypothetical protein
MKKILPISFLILLTVTFVSCELFPFFGRTENSHTQYFYNLAGDDEEDSVKTLTYRNDGHTIIMSCGVGGKELSKSEAEAILPTTSFSLKLDNSDITLLDDKEAKELGSSGYHVVQSSQIIYLEKGEYTLEGTTNFSGGESRTNKVYLTIE